MQNRLLVRCVCISAVFFLGFVVLCIYVFATATNPRVDEFGVHWSYVSLGNDVQITLTKDWGGSVIFFNQKEPAIGGSFIINHGDKNRTETDIGGGEFGFRFSLIKDSTRADKWWTLAFSLWYPIIISSILPIVFVARKMYAAKAV